MINYLISKLKAFTRWKGAKGMTRNSDIYCKDIDNLDKVCSKCHLTSVVEAQPPIFLYSLEGIEQLSKLFPLKEWTPKTTEAELAYSAGEQNVIRLIKQRTVQQVSTPI